MAVLKDEKRKSWRVYVKYKDWKGEEVIYTKRGFKTKTEAKEHEREFLLQKERNPNMLFSYLVEKLYLPELKPRIKYNTYYGKKYLIDKKILPYFGNKKVNSITVSDVAQWQNMLLNFRDKEGKAYKLTYIKTIENQLSAIFNYGIKHAGVEKNPVIAAGRVGKQKPAQEMQIWTLEEYRKFSEAMKSKPLSFYAFEVLYWTSIREGELLGLQRKHIDLNKRTLTICQSYQRIEGKDYLTSPKTQESNRVIDLDQTLCDELEDYFGMFYGMNPETRLFPVTKSYLSHEMIRGCEETGVKRIRIHDIRHSGVSLMINLGFSVVEIGARLGHASEKITHQYAHLYPSKGKRLADKLGELRVQNEEEVKHE